MLNKIILKFVTVLFLCPFLYLPVIAEGTYMIPRAKDLYGSGQYREAYDLAYSIAKDNPQCWEAYEIKAVSAFSLKNPEEALININKAITIADKPSLYNIRAKILYHLAYEKNFNNPNTQYINSLLIDINKMSLSIYDESNKNYVRNLLVIIAYSKVKIIDKLKLLTAIMASDKIYRNSIFFEVYGAAIKLAYNAQDSDFEQSGKTKSSIMSVLRQKAKKYENNDLYHFNNDVSDLVYYLMIEDYVNTNYVLSGINKNIQNKVYKDNNTQNLYYIIMNVNKLEAAINNKQVAGSVGMRIKNVESASSDTFMVVSVDKNSPADILNIKAGNFVELEYPSDSFKGYAGMPLKLRVFSGSSYKGERYDEYGFLILYDKFKDDDDKSIMLILGK